MRPGAGRLAGLSDSFLVLEHLPVEEARKPDRHANDEGQTNQAEKPDIACE